MLSDSTVAAIVKEMGAIGRTIYCVDVVVSEAGHVAATSIYEIETVPDGKHTAHYDEDTITVRGDVLVVTEWGGPSKPPFEARTKLPKGWKFIREK